jgi:hypothetical protein
VDALDAARRTLQINRDLAAGFQPFPGSAGAGDSGGDSDSDAGTGLPQMGLTISEGQERTTLKRGKDRVIQAFAADAGKCAGLAPLLLPLLLAGGAECAECMKGEGGCGAHVFAMRRWQESGGKVEIRPGRHVEVATLGVPGNVDLGSFYAAKKEELLENRALLMESKQILRRCVGKRDEVFDCDLGSVKVSAKRSRVVNTPKLVRKGEG